MTHRFPRRALPAMALAASLALPLPIHAWPLSPHLVQRARLWLAELWTSAPQPQPARTKAGMGVDPNGSPATTSATTACTGDCERGGGIDPNS
ncbi:MAG: hypothetical protein ACLGI9_24970 [Thermoanaerobaculia bacterium]